MECSLALFYLHNDTLVVPGQNIYTANTPGSQPAKWNQLSHARTSEKLLHLRINLYFV